MAYPAVRFELDQMMSLPFEGSPDLIAQMLDKLVENAVDFVVAGTPVRVSVEAEDEAVLLRVANRGPTLTDESKRRLFQAMVSGRAGERAGSSHLGLGLYVARLIAEFHGGGIEAGDLPEGGVIMSVRMNT
jgi:signal transduction histidine kinase